jgi:uncharacterized protein YndB with AHSA1/START domain
MGKCIDAKLTVAAEPPQLFHTLTRTQELTRWFCEYADISLESQRYDFWGRFTPGAPEQDGGRHPLLLRETDRRLIFAWRLGEAETTVDLHLEVKDEGTQVMLVHQGVPVPEPDEAHLTDFWALSLENLRSWIERGVVGPRCDFSTVPHGDVRASIDIAAPQETVYGALIRPDELERYIATRATVELHRGGHYDFGWQEGGPVKILELVPPEQLSYSWVYGDQPETVVTWTLEGSGGKTRLTLVHSGFIQGRKNGGYHAGWLKYLTSLKNLVEVGGRWQRPILRVSDFSSNQ